MIRPIEIQKQRRAMQTITNLAQAFEGIAGMHISQIKNQVLSAEQFFGDLWQIYTQIRVDSKFRFGRGVNAPIKKDLLVAITAEGGLSGDIDSQLIQWMLKSYDPNKHDIIVVGHHGALQLIQAGVNFKKYFKLPGRDQNINPSPLIKEVQLYQNTTVYYQTYVSLMVQDIKKIELVKAVAEQGKQAIAGSDVISEATYIFEPSTYAVVEHLESTMLQIMVGQLILESKLAQYASRFRAMSTASKKAVDITDDLTSLFFRSRRSQKDERLRETLNGLLKAGKQWNKD